MKLLDFCHTTPIESTADIEMPDQVDHLPPELLKILQMHNVQSPGELNPRKSTMYVNVIQYATQVDIFSLGTILFQMATGLPLQMELPLKCMIKNAK